MKAPHGFGASDRFRRAAQIVALASVYVAVARLGLMLDAVSGFATLVWPPTGISLAILYVFGSPLWPGVALGAFAANVLTGASVPVALGIALGNTLEAVVGAYALQRSTGFRPSLAAVRNVLELLLLAAVGSTMVSATCGVASLFLGGVVPTSRLADTWRAWWLGDMLANLVVAPLLLVWCTPRSSDDPRRSHVETVALCVGFVAAGLLVYPNRAEPELAPSLLHQSYVLFPVLMWTALRFGQRETVTMTFAVTVISVVGTALGRGPFVHHSLHEGLYGLQAFMAISASTFLMLGASISERRRALAELAQAQRGLETKVAERTLALTKTNADLRMAQQALESGRDDLERRVEGRTQEIRKLLVDLEETVRARDALISVASHELRTPLSALQLQVQLIARTLSAGQLEDASASALSSRITTVDRQVARLTRLIDGLLDVSRITAGKLQLEYEDVDLAASTTEVLSRFEEELHRANCSLTLAADTPVIGRWDRMRVEQILTNLVSNAIKYGAGRPIEIAVDAVGEVARLTVRDHGIGIAEGDRSRIFERFERLVAGRQAGGFGLGLWIVREVVDALGGTIGVESRVGIGTTFVVELPKGRAREHVLVVEDDRDVLDGLCEVLERAGYTVGRAENGREAMDYIARFGRPSVILLDLAMPVMSGRQFLDEKRRAAELSTIPVVLISADTELGHTAKELDVEGFLQKPVHIDALLSAVHRYGVPRASGPERVH